MKPFVAIPYHLIQVAGLQEFNESHWREAILSFINGIWSEDSQIMARPRIDFDGVVLEFNLNTRTYLVYGQSKQHTEELAASGRIPLEGPILEVPLRNRFEVESGLMHFIKNDRIVVLGFHVDTADKNSASPRLYLIKTAVRGQYIVRYEDLPQSWMKAVLAC